MLNASRSLDGFTPAALSASRYERWCPVTISALESPYGCGGPGGCAPLCPCASAVSDVGSPTVAIMSSATEHPVSSAADEATNNEVAEQPKKVAKPDVRRTAGCTPPRYRLLPGWPGDRKAAYLMVATSSPDIAPSCPDQLPQSWLGPSGKSKWPL